MKASAELIKDLDICSSAIGKDNAPHTMKSFAEWLRVLASKLEAEVSAHTQQPAPIARRRQSLDSRACKDS